MDTLCSRHSNRGEAGAVRCWPWPQRTGSMVAFSDARLLTASTSRVCMLYCTTGYTVTSPQVVGMLHTTPPFVCLLPSIL